jgi:hypothetical protein
VLFALSNHYITPDGRRDRFDAASAAGSLDPRAQAARQGEGRSRRSDRRAMGAGAPAQSPLLLSRRTQHRDPRLYRRSQQPRHAGDEEDESQHAVVERENAQERPHVEVAEVVRLVSGVVEDAGDEEAGQNEEQLDPVRPVITHTDDGALDPVGGHRVADEVEQQDQENG